jgi:hypothetical protein
MDRKEYERQWREKNKKKVIAYQKEYWKKNREKLLKQMSEYGKKWYQDNKEKKDKQNAEWSKNPENKKKRVKYVQSYVKRNLEKVKNYNKEYGKTIDGKLRYKKYNQTNKGKYKLLRRRHEKKWKESVILLEEFKYIVLQPCKYCGGFNQSKGIDRIKNSDGYTKENSVSCCKMCNYMKKNYSLKEFLSQIEKIYKHSL